MIQVDDHELADLPTGGAACRAHESEPPQLLRLFENSLDAMMIADDAGRYLEVNQAACELLGYRREQLLRMSVSQLVSSSGPSSPERYSAYLKAGREFGTFPFLRGDGEYRIAEYSAVRIGPDRNYSALRDVTERQRMEQELRDSEERFRQLAESIYRVFWLVSADLRETLYVNPQHQSVFGLPTATLYADFLSWLALVDAEDRAQVEQALARYQRQPEPVAITYRIHHPQRGVRWLQTSLFPVLDAAGRAYRHGGLTIDQTEQRQLQAALAASEQNFRTLVDSSLDGVLVIRDECVTFANRRMLAMLPGCELTDLLGRSLAELLLPADRPLLAAVLGRFTAADERTQPQLLHLQFRDNLVEVELTLVRVHYYGRPAIMAMLHDLTDRQQAKALREAITAEQATRLQTDAKLRRAQLLQALTDAVLLHSDEELLLTELATRVRALLGSGCVAVYRVVEEAGMLEAVAAAPVEHGPPAGTRIPLSDWVWASGPEGDGAPGHAGAAALLPRCRPPVTLIRMTPPGGLTIGLLAVAELAGSCLDKEDLLLLGLVAERVGCAIERSRLYRKLEQGEARLRLSSALIVETQERERRYLARELHDEVGQLLTALSLGLERAAKQTRGSHGSAMTAARTLSLELLARVRNISGSLRPPMLDDLGLLPTLEWHLDRVRQLTQLEVTLAHDGADRRFAPELEIAVYRVVQEALTNVVRHAGVGRAMVRLWSNSTTLAVQIVDHGVGFDSKVSPSGSAGLLGMQERVELLDGCYTVETNPGAGTSITAEFPLLRATR